MYGNSLFALQVHHFSCDGMGELQFDGTKLLMGQAEVVASVLRVAQNGAACMAAMDAELMGAACDGGERKSAVCIKPFQNPIVGFR